MKTFKQFILESPHLLDNDEIDKRNAMIKGDQYRDQKSPDYYERHLKDIDDKHELIARGPHGTKPQQYLIRNKKTRNVHISVWGHNTKEGHFWVENLKKNVRGKFGGAEFYNHLTDHGINLQSDTEQTPGGAHTWKQLHRNRPNVTVTRHNSETGEELPIHSFWDDNYEYKGTPSVFRATKKA